MRASRFHFSRFHRIVRARGCQVYMYYIDARVTIETRVTLSRLFSFILGSVIARSLARATSVINPERRGKEEEISETWNPDEFEAALVGRELHGDFMS